MNTLLNYQIIQKIYESYRSLVYQAYDQTLAQPVILKVLKQDYPRPDELTKYRREYDILQSLKKLSGVVKVYALQESQNTLVMVLEDFGGTSLKQYLLKQRLGLTDFLKMALQIVEILGQIHAANVIHKDLNPTNIIFNPLTQQLKITDFGIATLLPREQPTFKNPGQLEGTLAYMSPEQTGRMNRTIDYRTDFYALGATFYELLTQRLPFETTDTMELVHCHLAKSPEWPHLVNPMVPEMLSTLVMKLLAKTAEDRYQSAWGLKVDLEYCLHQLTTTGRINAFPLGQHDVLDKFQLPQKLYGRESQVNTLLKRFELVSLGHAELMLIAGEGGVGKSSLVHEIYKPITQKRGYFIAGKFDPLKRNIPYSALVVAFQDLVQQILTETEIQLTHWRTELLKALGANGQVISELIPELELIIGPTPAPPTLLNATEAQHRFNLVWTNFLRVCGTPNHPLVIFLDDLQWADSASLHLLTVMLTNVSYLFLIGAYRDNLVEATHPLLLTIEVIQRNGIEVQRLSCAPLDLPQTIQLLVDAFKSPLEETTALAELVYQKTQGNPFFINEFLKSLYAEKLIEVVPPFCDIESSVIPVLAPVREEDNSLSGALNTRDSDGAAQPQSFWRWDLAKIKERSLSDNVIKLLANKVQKLSSDTQRVLTLAACIGNQFELRILAIVYEKTAHDTISDLWEAIVEGLIFSLQETCDVMTPNEIANQLNIEYKFAHDQVRQTVYSFIPEEKRTAVHLQVGRTLLENLPTDQSEQNLFAVVDHLNLGMEWMMERSEREELALLNLIAGRKAKASAAYGPAFKHFKTGTILLTESGWPDQYELILALSVEAAEAAYLCADFAEMEHLVDTVLQRATTLLDKVKIYEVKIQALAAQNQLREAVQIALMVLKLLGVHFPDKPQKWHTVWWFWKAKLGLDVTCNRPVTEPGALATAALRINNYGARTIKELIDLPKMMDPKLLAVMRILSALYAVSYKAMPELLPLTVFKQVLLSIQRGNAPESAFAYSAYGALLCILEKDIEAGAQFGELALNLVERFQAKELAPRILVIVNTRIKHWYQPLKQSLQPLLTAYQLGLETGEIEFAVMAVNAYGYLAYGSGKDLMVLEKELSAYNQALAHLRHEGGMRLNHLLHQVVLNLLDSNEFEPASLVGLNGNSFKEEEMLPRLLQTNDQMTLGLLYVNKLILSYLFGQYDRAIVNARRAQHYLAGLSSLYVTPLFYFYDSLTQLAIYATVTGDYKMQRWYKQQRILRQVADNQRQMKRWASRAPVNYLHKYYLVEAERAQVLGKNNLAREYYHKAIATAQQHEYLNEEALAYELTAQFYQARKERQLAHYYFRNAYHAYQRWGATAKLRELEKRQAEMFFQSELPVWQTQSILSPLTTSISYSNEQNLSEALDLNSVLKASQTISEEIDLANLLAKLIKIVIENAGAQTGLLILMENDQLTIEAQGSIEQHQVTVLQSLSVVPLNSSESSIVPLSLVNYVARTHDSIVLSNAAHLGKFMRDPYIIKHQLKSVLCLPLLTQGQLTGILYLENNLSEDAFTPTRLEILNLLSAQIAISIKNAKLFADTRALNAKLRESEERFRIIAETTPIPLIITRIVDDIILYANAQAAINFGLSSMEPVGSHSITDFYDNPADQQQLREIFEKNGYIHNYELPVKKTDGSLLWVALFSHPIIYKHQKVLLSAIYDITDRKRAEEERIRFTKELSESEERFRVIAETTPIPLLIVRLIDNLILYANAQIEAILGLPPSRLINQQRLSEFYLNEADEKNLQQVFQAEGTVRNYELQFKQLGGTKIYCAIFIQPIIFKNEAAMASAIYDITDRIRAEEERIRFIQEREAKNAALLLNQQLQQEIEERHRAEAALAKANEELSRLATLDGLTQLANRRKFDEYIYVEWRRLAREQLPLSLVLCDIDYFKRYNDNYGHQAGDDCLRQVARAMNRAVKRPADLVARYGGEEFVVVLPNTKAEGAVQVAAAMQQEIAQLKLVHIASEVNPYVTLSLGVASTIPSQTFLPEVLINIADNALYEAKERGRNCIILKTV